MTELVTLLGRYTPGQPVALALRQTPEIVADRAVITITHLADCIATETVSLTGAETAITLAPQEAGGYGVDALLYAGEQLAGRASTAVNIGGHVVRYGFLSDFLPEDDADLARMAQYHIDHVQFYDWSYRHDTLVAPTEDYTDMMGKRNNLAVIRQKIEECHRRGMLAMAYGAVYAASRAFWEAHRTWGLYASAGRPMVFIDTFYYMDIQSPWREHLFAQYNDAVGTVGFDGIHMDTYGEPKHALSADGSVRSLEAALSALIRDADAAMRRAGHTPHLIFNNVSAWPVQATCGQPQDAVYLELWPPMDRYRHLRQAAQWAASAGKPVVLAAYPAPFRTDSPERALYSELLLSFAIALCGATQLFLGEGDAVVTQGYYADYTRLLPWQATAIQAYQDFCVRYEDLLFDPALTDVSMTHCGWDNQEYACEQPYSPEGEGGKLWLTFREGGGKRLIGLINLCGNDDAWNTGKERPPVQEAITLRVLTMQGVKAVWHATPDDGIGAPQQLPHTERLTALGVEVAFTVPSLACVALVWMA
ncbi:MAG: glycoside hydrolase family 66 protein [Candidatus Limiplasma sp.]|nr:glycoside hydrolase family 66 protein [Candidatus Limiplasma sp.]